MIEEEENDELIEDLESNSETREQEFKSLLAEIRRVASEVRDAKRFNVYKQMHDEESNQMSQQMTQMEEAEDGNGEMENEMEEQPGEEDEESSQNQM